MKKRIFTVADREDLTRCFPILKELRPHLTFEVYLSIYDDSHKADGYQIVAVEEDKQILAIMGFRFLSDYVRGKHIYIDDLVTSKKFRSSGLGTELLKHAEEIAKSLDSKTLRLSTGVENEQAVKFYERNGWTKRAFAYTKKLNSTSPHGTKDF